MSTKALSPKNLSKRKLRQANREFVYNFLKKNPCVDCKEKDVTVLDFDHTKGNKKLNIARMVSNGTSLSKLKEEIAKCKVRCANCHRRKTAKERKSYKYIRSKEN